MSARRTPVSPRQERLRFGPPSSPAPRRAPAPRPAGRTLRDTGCEAAAAATELVRPRALAREGRTLEDVLSGAWEDLSGRTTTACPVCDGAMVLSQAGGVVVAACTSCASELA